MRACRFRRDRRRRALDAAAARSGEAALPGQMRADGQQERRQQGQPRGRSTYRCQAELLKLGCAVLGCPNRLLRRDDVATPARPAHLVADPVLDAPAEVGPQRAGALRLEPVEPCEGVW